MKIAVISLNLSGGQAVFNFLSTKKINDKDISCKYFYDYSAKKVGDYEESLVGLNTYIDEIYDQYDAFIEFPVSFGYEYLYSKDSDTKFIYIKRTLESWIEQMNNLKNSINYEESFYFEEFFCNHYVQTNKIKINDLTDEELEEIYNMHNQSVLSFFEESDNFISIDFADEFVFTKIGNFLNL